MEKTSLAKFAERLLDLGKRNRLLYFTPSRFGSLKLLSPSSATLFEKLPTSTLGVKLLLDDPLYEKGKNPTEADVKLAYEKKSNSTNALFFNASTPNGKVLKALQRKAASALSEQGTQLLYLAFLFVHYVDPKDHLSYKAPLLLLPVALEGGTPSKGYALKAASEDIELNPTFSYFASTSFGLSLPSYSDEGLAPYAEKILPLIAPLGWTLDLLEVELSSFAFEKMSLYLDLKNNAKTALANPLIQALLGDGSALPPLENSPESPSSLDQYAFHNVFSADGSQLQAIAFAKKGESFVLQGPPGTGKSQTITNIIAEALHDKKKVLFVSEKLAALNVVYENLKKANLTDFALELHSDKSDKRALYSELAKSLYAYKTTLSEEEKDDIDELIKSRNALDDYAKAIQTPTSFGKSSLYELIDSYLQKEGTPSLHYVRKSVSSYTKDEHLADLALLERYLPYAALFGNDYRKWALKDLELPRLTYEERASFLSSLETSSATLNQILPLLKEASALFKKELTSLGEADALVRFASTSGTLYEDSSFYARKRRKEWKDALTLKKAECLAIHEEKKRLEKELHFTSTKEELVTLLAQEKKGYGFLGLLKTEAKANKALLERNVLGGRSRKEKVQLLAEGLSLQKREEEFLASLPSLTPFSAHLDGLSTDWDAFLSALSPYEEASLSDLFEEDFHPETSSKEFHKALKAIADALEPLLFALKEPLALLLPYYPHKYPAYPEVDAASFKKDADLALQMAHDLESHAESQLLLHEIQDASLLEFLNAYLDKGLSLSLLSASYEKDTLLQEIYYQASLDPLLAHFSKDERNGLIAHYKELDELQYRISRHQIAERLSEGRPSALNRNADPVVSKILHEHEKKRKLMPTRYLLENYFKTVSDLKPLFLMSPLSVSTYLPPDASFDLVVFDEASQIFPEDALGAIYRGKEAIIVGDEHQLPPTSFFLALDEEATDDEENYSEDNEDYESILDLASGAFPSKRLLWHYRSKDESLIAFSNHEIYDSSLYSFPNPSKRPENGVHAHYIKEGVYLKKSRNNPLEAKATAALLFALAKKYPERSFGIVAFSESQQDAIYDAIDELREKDASLEKTLFARQEEPLFVKNLETVQGDERDVILLSIGYAKDESGHFYQRFGPLNAIGGERRLNVAITRAKYALEVLSSFQASDLDETKTPSEGVKLLKAYLLYAEKGTPLSFPTSLEGDGLLNHLLSFLRSQGYEGELHYGDSLGRIELAVKEKGAKDYLLAIESDGPLFQKALTSRDRDELREEELRLMGWGYYRLYAESYLKNPERIQEEILALLSILKKEKGTPEEISIAPDPATPLTNVKDAPKDIAPKKEEPVNEEPSESEAYVQDRSIVSPYLVLKRGVLYRHVEMRVLTNKILSLIQNEGPINGALLYRRLALLANNALIPEGAGEALTSLVEHLRLPGIKEENGFFYRSSLKNPYLFRPFDPTKGESRNPEDIPYPEIANGMKSFLKGKKPMAKEELYAKMNSALGYSDSEMKERYYYEDAIQKDDELSLDTYDRIVFSKAE
jgi:superfamily I DNA and/or RNA helicase